MTIRDERQLQFANDWLNNGNFGILNLCPRFGKIRTAINVFKKLSPKSILIAYPDNKIKTSWENDFNICGYSDANVTYTTYLSLKKYTKETFDIVVLDEIHLLSEAQITVCKELFKANKQVLGLTGTLSHITHKTLLEELKLRIVATYSIDQAITEGVIADYEITVIKVPLDVKTKENHKGKMLTEKQKFDQHTWVINMLEEKGRDTMFLRLARMRIIQNSLAKLNKTKEILNQHPYERILVFCGITKIADTLGIPSYHSKSSEKQTFENFANGIGNHLAVVKIGNTGVTYKPLNRVIINYFDSNGENLAQKINRCMSMEYDNPDKKAHIYIVSSNEQVEQKWLNKALEFFDKSKITYICQNEPLN